VLWDYSRLEQILNQIVFPNSVQDSTLLLLLLLLLHKG